jgi:uncharacterized membrane protein YphA (DoxX/SURF4 family)
MRYDEIFVSSIAIGLAVIAAATAIGPWEGPYRLRTARAIGDRFGKPAARLFWLLLAVLTLLAGLAILSGVRPHYAIH